MASNAKVGFDRLKAEDDVILRVYPDKGEFVVPCFLPRFDPALDLAERGEGMRLLVCSTFGQGTFGSSWLRVILGNAPWGHVPVLGAKGS
jgi:hypothetical protein